MLDGQSLLFHLKNETDVEKELLSNINKPIQTFINTIQEEQFQKQYFYQVPLNIINQQIQSI